MLANKNMRKTHLIGPVARCMLIIVCMAFMGCQGGLIGTSTGPEENAGSVVVMPEKLGPRIPDALLENDSPVSMPNESANSKFSVGPLEINTDDDTTPAQSWQQLSPHFSQFEYMRIALQLELQLLESVYDSVFERCGQLTSIACVIPAGEIRATLTAAVIDDLLLDNEINNENMLSMHLRAGGVDQFLAIGDEVEFGEINIQKFSDAPYDYRLTISPLSLLADKVLQLDWSADFSNVRYSLQVVGSTVVDRYYYQRLPGAQRLTLSDTFVDTDNIQSSVALEVISGAIDDGNVQFNAHIAGNNIKGWATDNDAFASSLINGESENIILQESFQSDGNVLNSTRCEFDSVKSECVAEEQVGATEPTSVAGVISSFSNEVEFAEITITNLPANYNNFVVRRNEVLHSNDVPELLCLVYTLTDLTGKPFADVYCFTDIALALDGIVVAIDSDGNEFIIDEARISEIDSSSQDTLAIGPVSNVAFDGVKITWDELPGAVGYSIYLDGYYLETVGAVLEYTPVRSGAYTIIGFDEFGNFSPREVIDHDSIPLSNRVVVLLSLDAPSLDEMPLAPVSNVAFNGKVITWDEVPGAVGYDIYLHGYYLDTVGVVPEYTPMNSGSYTIIGFDGLGNFSPREVITHDSVPLSNRVLVSLWPVSNAAFNGEKITWDELPEAVGYNIYIDDFLWETVTVPEFTPWIPGTFTIVGFDEMGNSNSGIEINQNVTDSTDGPQLEVVMNVSFDGELITWDPVPGAIGYNIYNDFGDYIDTVIAVTEYRPVTSGIYFISGFDNNGSFSPLFVAGENAIPLTNNVEVIIR